MLLIKKTYQHFGFGSTTLQDKNPSGNATPLCSRYDSRIEACFLASAT